MTETLLEREMREQRRWRPLPSFASSRVFDWLVVNEFDPPARARTRIAESLSRILRHAVENVPYYRDLFRERGLRASAIASVDDLGKLPLLTREIVQTRPAEMRAERLPAGTRRVASTRTSGTTGQPVVVDHTAYSRLMFQALKQREYRWWRSDPMAKLAAIRNPKDLPRVGGAIVAPGITVEQNFWPRVGRLFHTGPFIGFSNWNEPEQSLRWLLDRQPAYLTAMAADLEHLALASRGGSAAYRPSALHSISQQLTADMRRLVEESFDAPVHENYGLNEIGIVASRCPESGWFHVHAEHCLVEVVGDAGEVLPAGRRGRLVVTALSNPAMPLIRYDADDLGALADEPCPCGRSLPSLRDLFGRYRRTASLPPGTWAQWTALQRCLGALPPEIGARLRQYQLHQFRDGRFELAVVTSGELPAEFVERVHAAWSAAGAAQPPSLSILHVERIARSPGGKFQNFVSDWAPAPTAPP